MKRTDRLIKVSIGGESDKDSNSCPAQLRKLMGFLEQSSSPFAESHHAIERESERLPSK